jgi:hypothetical protein
MEKKKKYRSGITKVCVKRMSATRNTYQANTNRQTITLPTPPPTPVPVPPTPSRLQHLPHLLQLQCQYLRHLPRLQHLPHLLQLQCLTIQPDKQSSKPANKQTSKQDFCPHKHHRPCSVFFFFKLSPSLCERVSNISPKTSLTAIFTKNDN